MSNNDAIWKPDFDQTGRAATGPQIQPGISVAGLTPTSVVGGGGGTEFSDASFSKDSKANYITGMRITYGNTISRIQVLYDGTTWTDNRGGGKSYTGMKEDVFYLQRGEVIVKVEGRSGALVDALKFTTNLGRSSGMYGGVGGVPFTWTGSKLVCFSGRSGEQLENLQAHFLP